MEEIKEKKTFTIQPAITKSLLKMISPHYRPRKKHPIQRKTESLAI
jgi:hypothetical protein